MFGYVTAQLKLLSEQDRRRYSAYYCGLCRALGERHGEVSRLTLTYDMSFLVILLSSLYEPESAEGEARCVAHPNKPRAYIINEITNYAADMNVALSYQKLMDDWHDDHSLISLAESGVLKSSYERILRSYPRQCEAIIKGISDLNSIEETFLPMPDAAARSFGELMAELFVYKEDRWSDTLRSFGNSLGQFIYVMDACIDLRDDKRYYKYNPFVKYFNLTDERERFEDILKLLMGDCVFYFDKLPLVSDVAILKNILCTGVWNKFNKHYNITEEAKGEESDGAGPLQGARRFERRE